MLLSAVRRAWFMLIATISGAWFLFIWNHKWAPDVTFSCENCVIYACHYCFWRMVLFKHTFDAFFMLLVPCLCLEFKTYICSIVCLYHPCWLISVEVLGAQNHDHNFPRHIKPNPRVGHSSHLHYCICCLFGTFISLEYDIASKLPRTC